MDFKRIFGELAECLSERRGFDTHSLHSGQTHNACAFPAKILQRKIQTNVERFTLTAKQNAISENLSFLGRVCV